MWAYIFVYGFLLSLVFLDVNPKLKNVKFAGLYFSFIALLALVGLRDETGTDWQSYKDNYESVLMGGEVNPHFEAGYNFLVSFFSNIGFNYATFLFAYTFLYLIIFYNFFSKCKNPNTIVLLFYTAYVIGYMGAARQILAIALCLNAFYFLTKCEEKKFFLLVFIAGFVHYPSLSFLLLYFMRVKMSYSLKNLVLIGALSFIAFINLPWLLNSLVNLPIFSEQILNYVVNDDGAVVFMIDDNAVIFLMFLKRTLFIYLFIYFLNKRGGGVDYQIALNSYIFGFLVFSILYFLIPAVGVRLSLYFSILDIFLFAYFIDFKKRSIFLLSIVLIFSAERFYSSLTYDADMLIPYKSLIINQEVHRIIRQ